MFFVIFPKNQEERVLAGANEAGLVILRSRSVHFREGEAPLLALYQMGRLTDIPERFRTNLAARGAIGWEEPPLTIRLRNGEVHPEYSVAKLSVGFPP
jgi:hypothetical protein